MFDESSWLKDFDLKAAALKALCEQWLMHHSAKHAEAERLGIEDECEICPEVEAILQAINASTWAAKPE